MKKVLILEDEEDIRDFIVINLKRAGYETIEAAAGEQALEILNKSSDIDIAVLDVMLPGIDGFHVLKEIRKTNSTMGIIMLTARTQEMDKIMGLSNGADDYVTKPFSTAELVARVDAMYRRIELVKKSRLQEEIKSGRFLLNCQSRTLYKDNKIVEVTQVEYSLIKYFLENQDAALSRDDLLNAAWGIDFFGDPKIVDVNIRRLRQKVEDDPSNPKFIITIWGYGYRWGKENV